MTDLTPGELHALIAPLIETNAEMVEGVVIIIAMRADDCICDPDDPCIAWGMVTDFAGNTEAVEYMLVRGLTMLRHPDVRKITNTEKNGPSPFS